MGIWCDYEVDVGRHRNMGAPVILYMSLAAVQCITTTTDACEAWHWHGQGARNYFCSHANKQPVV